MSISLSPDTQKLIEDRMRQAGYPSADKFVQAAIEAFDEIDVPPLDEKMQAAIDHASAHIARGEYVHIDEVRREFEAKFKGK